MLTSFQWRWGVAQWVEFLKDKEIPVLLRTQALIQALASLDAASTEAISARELAGYVFADPYLSLKLLRHAETSARAQGARRLFVLTTRTSHWFLKRGFVQGGVSDLPHEKRAHYNHSRNSLIFIKRL